MRAASSIWHTTSPASRDRLARFFGMPSQVIRGFEYDAERRHLDIVFVTGRIYRYFDVPPGVSAALRKAFSKGEYFNQHIRDAYAVARLVGDGQPDLFGEPETPALSTVDRRPATRPAHK